jgi:2-(1,2-epoxy-1,2-dihydrophenyl)acetyl-CoA isomerase
METIVRSLDAGVLTLSFNRADKLNAFNSEMTGDLIAALREAGRDNDVRVIVLTGAGRGFSSGQDLAEFADARMHSPDFSIREHLRSGYNVVTTLIRSVEKPVIAAMNGVAAGVGLSIALACDLRFAADDATFTLGFSRIGLIPDGGASMLLPALVGLGKAFELAYSSARIDAAEALRTGLVQRVVPAAELLDQTRAFAAELIERPQRGLALTKRAMNRAMLPALDAWLEEEADLQEQASHGADHIECVAAFVEKRRPVLVGK